MTDDTPITQENEQGDQIDARESQGFVNRPSAPVTQHISTTVNLGPLKIPKPIAGILLAGFVAVVMLIGANTLYTRGTFQAVTAPTPTPMPTVPTATPTITPLPTATPLAFATQGVSETLIVIATFHNTAATNSEAHTKIRRAIASEAAKQSEEKLRVEVDEQTELTADQRAEAEALGKRYNASMVIWGEDTGVEIIVNFLNLKEPNFDAAATTITETERTQLANPSAYARFITGDLPRTMSFFAFFAVGQSYDMNTEYPLAIKRIETAIALVPPDAKPEGLAEAYFGLGWLYQVATPNNLNQAIANYDQAILLTPDYAFAYNNRGNSRKAQGQLGDAIKDYDQAIKLNPKFVKAYNNRGSAYSDQNNLAAAIKDYNQAIQLDPKYALAYYNRGIAYHDKGNLASAIKDYNQAIKLDSNYTFAYFNRGNARRSQGDLSAAIEDYDHAIKLDLKLAEAYNNRGITYYSQGNLDAAIDNYDQAIELDDKYAVAYHNRGNARGDQGDLAAAIEDYNQAIKLDPKFAVAYYSRGNARGDQGDLSVAVEDYNQAIKIDPKYVDAYINRGTAHFNLELYKDAFEDYDQVIHLNSTNANAYLGRGIVRHKLSDLKGALADFRYYLELRPNDPNRKMFEQWIAEIEMELAKQK